MNKARVGLTAAVMMVALGACGGGGSLSKAVSAGTTGSRASGDASTASSAAPSPDAASTSSPSSGSGSGDICAYAKDLSASDITSSLGSGSGNMKDEFAKLDSVLNTLQSKAPSEIKSDVDTLASAVKKLEALYAKVGYDSSKVASVVSSDPQAALDAEQAVTDPKFSAAAEHITSYFQKNCS